MNQEQQNRWRRSPSPPSPSSTRSRPGSRMIRFLYSSGVARIVPFTEARARLTELLDDVEARHEHVVITRKGRPAAVVVSPEEWEALEETLDVLQDEQTLADLRGSEGDVKAGRLFSLDEVRRELGLA